MTAAPFTPHEAFSFGWQAVKKHLPLFLGLSLLQLLVSALEGGSAGRHHGSNTAVHLAAQLAGVVLAMGWWRICLRVHDRQPVSLAAVAEITLAQFLNYFLTTIVLGIIVVVGLVLLVVPGVLWALRYGLAPILVIDENLDPAAAIRRSAQLTEGARGELFAFGLLVAALNLAGLLALGLGLVVTMPISAMAAVFVYRRLKARAALPASPDRPQLAAAV